MQVDVAVSLDWNPPQYAGATSHMSGRHFREQHPSTVGREVTSTPMQWAYESKKLDAAVKHLSWVPPWVEATENEEPAGRC